MSAWPSAMTASACSGSVIRPTAITGISVLRRTVAANGTW